MSARSEGMERSEEIRLMDDEVLKLVSCMSVNRLMME